MKRNETHLRKASRSAGLLSDRRIRRDFSAVSSLALAYLGKLRVFSVKCELSHTHREPQYRSSTSAEQPPVSRKRLLSLPIAVCELRHSKSTPIPFENQPDSQKLLHTAPPTIIGTGPARVEPIMKLPAHHMAIHHARQTCTYILYTVRRSRFALNFPRCHRSI